MIKHCFLMGLASYTQVLCFLKDVNYIEKHFFYNFLFKHDVGTLNVISIGHLFLSGHTLVICFVERRVQLLDFMDDDSYVYLISFSSLICFANPEDFSINDKDNCAFFLDCGLETSQAHRF